MILTLIRAIQSWRIYPSRLYVVLVNHNIFYYVCGLRESTFVGAVSPYSPMIILSWSVLGNEYLHIAIPPGAQISQMSFLIVSLMPRVSVLLPHPVVWVCISTCCCVFLLTYTHLQFPVHDPRNPCHAHAPPSLAGEPTCTSLWRPCSYSDIRFVICKFHVVMSCPAVSTVRDDDDARGVGLVEREIWFVYMLKKQTTQTVRTWRLGCPEVIVPKYNSRTNTDGWRGPRLWWSRWFGCDRCPSWVWYGTLPLSPSSFILCTFLVSTYLSPLSSPLPLLPFSLSPPTVLYTLHRTKSRSSVIITAVVLPQRLEARFISQSSVTSRLRGCAICVLVSEYPPHYYIH